MPIYERRCCKCKQKFSHMCKMAERENDADCPDCGWQFTNPVMSAPQTTFTFADPSPFKGTKHYTGRRAKYIQDEHSLIEE